MSTFVVKRSFITLLSDFLTYRFLGTSCIWNRQQRRSSVAKYVWQTFWILGSSSFGSSSVFWCTFGKLIGGTWTCHTNVFLVVICLWSICCRVRQTAQLKNNMSLIPKEEIYVLAAIKGLEILEFSGAATQRLKVAK